MRGFLITTDFIFYIYSGSTDSKSLFRPARFYFFYYVIIIDYGPPLL